MATPSFGNAEFLFGSCQVCGKQVLTYADFAPNDDELRRCIHCDTILTSGLQASTSVELQASGYAVMEARTCGDGGGCAASGCGQRK
jgi:hypothetical protein